MPKTEWRTDLKYLLNLNNMQVKFLIQDSSYYFAYFFMCPRKKGKTLVEFTSTYFFLYSLS